MVAWLVPISVFWLAAMVYLGFLAMEPVGGSGLRQVLALCLNYLLFLGVWGVLHGWLEGLGPVRSVVAATAGALILYAPLTLLAFRVVGLRLQRVDPVPDAH